MVNAWSLLWEEINGTMDETYPIKEKKMTEKPEEPDDYAKLVDHLKDFFILTKKKCKTHKIKKTGNSFTRLCSLRYGRP